MNVCVNGQMRAQIGVSCLDIKALCRVYVPFTILFVLQKKGSGVEYNSSRRNGCKGSPLDKTTAWCDPHQTAHQDPVLLKNYLSISCCHYRHWMNTESWEERQWIFLPCHYSGSGPIWLGGLVPQGVWCTFVLWSEFAVFCNCSLFLSIFPLHLFSLLYLAASVYPLWLQHFSVAFNSFAVSIIHPFADYFELFEASLHLPATVTFAQGMGEFSWLLQKCNKDSSTVPFTAITGE